MEWAAWAPDCMAISATYGRSPSAIRSPTTNTSGCVGSEQSGLTLTRPALSVSAPAAAARMGPRPAARIPAAQILVAAAIRSLLPSFLVISTPSSSMSVTVAPRWISTPMRVRSRCVMRDR